MAFHFLFSCMGDANINIQYSSHPPHLLSRSMVVRAILSPAETTRRSARPLLESDRRRRAAELRATPAREAAEERLDIVRVERCRDTESGRESG